MPRAHLSQVLWREILGWENASAQTAPELDYVYFAFGSLGAILAVNRMNAVGEKLILSDLYCTALGPVGAAAGAQARALVRPALR